MSENRAEATYSFKKEMTEIEWLLRIFDPESPQDALISYARFFEQTLTAPHSESRPQIHSEFTTDSGYKSAVSYFRHAGEAYVSKLKISWMEPASTQNTRNSNEIFAEEVWRLGEVNVNASYSREFAPAGSFRRFAFGKITLTSEFIKVHRQRLEKIVKESLDGPIFFPVSRESTYWQPQRRDELLARMKSEVGALLGHQIVTHRSWNAAIPSYPQNPSPGKVNPGNNKSVKDGEGRSKGQRPKPNSQSDNQKTSKSLDRSSTTQQNAAIKTSHLGFLQERFPKRAEELRQHALSGKKLSGELKDVANKVNNIALYFLAYQEADSRSDEDHYLGQLNDTVKVHGVFENKAGMTDFEIMLGLMCAVDEFGRNLVLSGIVDETFGILVAHRDRRNT